MKFSISILISLLATFCYGQNFNPIDSETERYYRITIESIDLDRQYPDGRYKIFQSDTGKVPTFIIHLRKGKVHGPYLKLKSCSWTIGNYESDSLWTFLNDPKDTTFKIGTWRNYICGLDIYETTQYKIPFDSNGFFKETWQFENGKTAREAIFKKGFGIEKETYWDFETNRIKKQTVNSGTKNFHQSVTYENDSISYVSLFQNGMEVSINFKNRAFAGEKGPSLFIAIDKEQVGGLTKPITEISIDSSETITDFRDAKRQIFFSENEEGNIEIQYRDNKGKLKYKTLKIR